MSFKVIRVRYAEFMALLSISNGNFDMNWNSLRKTQNASCGFGILTQIWFEHMEICMEICNKEICIKGIRLR